MTLKFTPRDLDIATRTLYGEGEKRGGGAEDEKLIAWVIRNRAEYAQEVGGHWWGDTIEKVCLHPWQFSCWNQNDPNRAVIVGLNATSSEYKRCEAIARNVFESPRNSDPTKSADHYFHDSIDAPNWSKQGIRTISLGGHNFYRIVIPVGLFNTTATVKLQDIYKEKIVLHGDAIASNPQLARQIQVILASHELLDPPVDGRWGTISQKALTTFQRSAGLTTDGLLGPRTAEALIEMRVGSLPAPSLILTDDLASRIVRTCQSKNYRLSTDDLNIIYIEGMNPDGTLNSDRPNEFNDLRLILQFRDNKPVITHRWVATTEPGNHYTVNPMNPNGAARLAFGQYKAWRIGIHGNSEPHAALVQVVPLPVHRDRNKDHARAGDKVFTGLFGINQHHGYDLPRNNIGLASAGCLVGRTRREHLQEFIPLLQKDSRYLANRQFIFPTTILWSRDIA
jgi:hypothetical protein